MGRKKAEIKPIRAERLKILINDTGLTQIQFAKKVSHSQQSISRIINMKNALTEDTAKGFVKTFPKYRIEWLLGYDDYMTETEKFIEVIKESQKEADLLYSGALAFLRLSGYDISPAHENNGTLEGSVKAIASGYIISRDGQSITMDLLQFNRFANKISDYVDFELQHMISINSDQ